jgi:phage terminase large subunit-like protein
MPRKAPLEESPAAPPDYLAIAVKYARGCVSGKIVVGGWMRKAAQRFLDDLKASRAKGSAYVFSRERAYAAVAFIELLPHIKGEWARRNETIRLEPWQVFITCNLFGFLVRATGLRRFRRAYMSVSRKNAKSTFASAVGLYMLCGDGEPGAEVYALATTRDQAGIVFNDARAMVKKSAPLAAHYGLDPGVLSIARAATNASFKPLPGDPGDGTNPHCAIIDEYHEHDSPRSYDAMYSGMGARSQPLILVTTTAGYNRSGPCYAMEAYAHRVLDQRVDDASLFAAIYTLDPEDNWADPANWPKSNPNLGVSVGRDNLAEACFEAQNNTVKQVNFLTKRMNVWCNAGTQWMDARDWDACADPTLSLEDFAGRRAVLGLDLASKIDLCALEVLIEDGPRWVRFGLYYLPDEPVQAGASSTHAHYYAWHLDGRLTLTPGNITDYGYIKADLQRLCRLLRVEAVAYDPYQATQLATELLAEKVPMVEVKQTVANLSEPMKELLSWTKSRKIAHEGCPVMGWQLSNVVAYTDAKDNIYPRKESPENKIDSPVALIMAVSRAMVPTKPKPRSVYELQAEAA